MLSNVELLKDQSLYRERRLRHTELDFSSNDYLALSEDARLPPLFQQAFCIHPIGSGGSTVVCGYHAAHQQLEQAFCNITRIK